jgi:murein DD-endopeptidase MepM/ murein hydrolase activator NlpD
MQLSGGFGDLRANHYHAGIDFRTRSSEGHAMRAVRSGYISRASVSPSGYGLAVYITHPDDSLMTVYGHLQRFTPAMAELMKAKQYENESFSIDLRFEPDDFPVKQGDLIGYSGNTGNSSGPHLHFEVRDMRTNDLIDPLVFYQSRIPDTQKPQVQGLRIYPFEGSGMANGSNKIQNIEFRLDNNGNVTVPAIVEAWGEIGLGIRAVDRMNGTNFSYGVKDILLTVDSLEIFRSYMDRFSLEESRYLNSYTDYEEWSKNRIFYIKTFVEPGNRTRFIASRNYGKIDIREERIYNALITLTDLNGNVCKVPLKIKGKKQDIAPPDTIGTKLLRWYDYNTFEAKGIRMAISRNSLYKNVYMHHRRSVSEGYDYPVYTLHTVPVPLHYPANLSIYLDISPESDQTADSLATRMADSTLAPTFVSMAVPTRQYGIVRIAIPTGRMTWIGGVYRDGWIDAEISELGTYTVMRDTIPPIIRPVEPARWRERKKINIRISDNLSGISSFRGEINGSYALFEYDSKNSLLTYTFDDERLQKGNHQLTLTVTDRGGNTSEYFHLFTR